MAIEESPQIERRAERQDAMSKDTPGGAVPERSLWQSTVLRGADGQMKEVGIRAPDGAYHPLLEGEHSVVRKLEGEDYEVAIVGADGTERILQKSAARQREERESENNQKIAELQQKLGIHTAPERSEMKEASELNERIKIAASYLDRLDLHAEHVRVDPETGAILFQKPELGEVVDEQVKQYQQQFTTLLQIFAQRNASYKELLRKDPHVLDVKEVAGALVATYDSSKGTPVIFHGEMFEGEKDSARGRLAGSSEKYLGLAIIDINVSKRTDGVSPTVSAVHELQHHMLSVSDYLMSQDPALAMQSAYRKGRSTALYGGGRDRITTGQAFLHDAEQYSAALGRPFDLQTELPRVEAQLSYLDELHSSFLQRKDSWFNAQADVYSTKGRGKHWELVGGHPDDVAASKTLLGYAQGFYTLDKIAQTWEQMSAVGQPVGEGQKRFIEECQSEFRRVGSLMGSARTVRQAERLVAEEWRAFSDKHARVLQTPVFKSMLDQWEQGAGVGNLRDILGKP